MRRLGTIAMVALAIALAGCGGDEGDGDSEASAATEEEARTLVMDAIAAWQEEDYATLCELSSEEINTAIPKAMSTDTCEQGYAEAFRRQDKMEDRPLDAYVEMLGKTEVGNATLTDTGATVDLASPDGLARSYLIDEAGKLKVQELFLLENAPASQAGGSTVTPGG